MSGDYARYCKKCGKMIAKPQGESYARYRTRKYCPDGNCRREYQNKVKREAARKPREAYTQFSSTEVNDLIERNILKIPESHPPVRMKFDGDSSELIARAKEASEGVDAICRYGYNKPYLS